MSSREGPLGRSLVRTYGEIPERAPQEKRTYLGIQERSPGQFQKKKNFRNPRRNSGSGRHPRRNIWRNLKNSSWGNFRECDPQMEESLKVLLAEAPGGIPEGT